MKRSTFLCLALTALVSLSGPALAAPEQLYPSGARWDRFDAATIDAAVLAQWVDGHESPMVGEKGNVDPTSVVWTTTTRTDFRGLKFGEGRFVGVRQLRIGFNEPLPIGSVLVRGGGALSVLKADAAYPGDLADDSQWIAAERIVDGKPSKDEVNTEGLALWTLPEGTKTRALRFTHTPTPGDREMAGWLGGVWIARARVTNVAPQAIVQSAMRDDASRRIVNELNDHTWGAWDNGEHGAAVAISPDHPELVTFTWPRPVELAGVCLIWAGFSSCEIDAFTGAASDIIAEAPSAAWQRVAGQGDIRGLYPLQLAPALAGV